jgi:hypothetical protein
MRIRLGWRAAVAISAFAGLVSENALAWGPEGHALVGQIADQLLAGTSAGQHVDSVLGGSYTLETAAKWPDCVRSVHREASGEFKFVPDMYTGPCKAFETADEEARMEDYARRNWDTFPYQPGHGDHEAYHFADVPVQHGTYNPIGDIGESEHDVVHAINAAIAKLTGQPVPAPFSIKDDKEAILILAHFVGDIHQPLHVGAVYLDAEGNVVEPRSESDADTDNTAGGNLISVGKSANLHHEWDSIPASFPRDVAELVMEAKAIPADSGSFSSDWAVTWASESVAAAKDAYSGITFSGEGPQKWGAAFNDRSGYRKQEHIEQEKRIVQAGARLAAIFKAIWP